MWVGLALKSLWSLDMLAIAQLSTLIGIESVLKIALLIWELAATSVAHARICTMHASWQRLTFLHGLWHGCVWRYWFVFAYARLRAVRVWRLVIAPSIVLAKCLSIGVIARWQSINRNMRSNMDVLCGVGAALTCLVEDVSWSFVNTKNRVASSKKSQGHAERCMRRNT